MRRSAICMNNLSLMQLWGSFSQSVLQRNLSQANQPMGGVRARPLSRAEPSPARLETARASRKCSIWKQEGQTRWSVETSLQTEDQELHIVCSHKFTVVQLRQYYYSTLSYSYTRDICSCYVLLCWSDSHLLFPSKIPTKNNKRTRAVDSVFSCSSLSIGDTEDSLINWSLKEELELDQL